MIDKLVEDFAGIRKALDDFRDEYREDRDEAKKGRGTIVVASISAVGLILVALIGAIVQLIGAAPT